jgi:hypothetical protein
MARATPETHALLEQALRHVLAEQAKLLNHKHAALLIESAKTLGDLAAETLVVLSAGMHKVRATSHLTKKAHEIERLIDDLSEKHWFYLSISVSSIYQRIEESLNLRPVQERLKLGTALTVRNHFHNLRLLLLEQILGARMLINNNDYGSEVERVLQQFLQAELGPEFRVLQGGHILNYAGEKANAQIDLIIVPADAHVMQASSADGSKVNVLCDQVIAAIMTTSNLEGTKLTEDWEKLRRLSELFKFTDEFPDGKEQAWPLCYVISAQSDPLEGLTKKWEAIVESTPDSNFVPQFLMSLDTGFAYSGATSWPRPRYPGNYVERDHVNTEQGIYAGLGIAWILTQIRARAKLLQNRSHRSIQRFTKLLDDATLKEATPPTWAPRFDKFGTHRPIEGILDWGGYARWAHNRLYLCCLEKRIPDLMANGPFRFFREGVDVKTLGWKEEPQYLRWFRHGTHWSARGLIALEEWRRIGDGPGYACSYAVFDSATGDEIKLDMSLRACGPDDIQLALESLRSESSSTAQA